MAKKTINARIQSKHDKEANWKKAATFVPENGEIVIYETPDMIHPNQYDSTSIPRIKVGNGRNLIGELPFITDAYVTKEEGAGLYPEEDKQKLNELYSRFNSSAAYNDYAEYRSQNESIQPGYITYCDDDGKLKLTTEKLQKFEGVVSDTFGFSIGKTEENQTPLAVSGRVLVYTDTNDNFHSGDVVCAGPNGLAYRMTREEIIEFSDRIVGIVSEIPTYDSWGKDNIMINGRVWIKVK